MKKHIPVLRSVYVSFFGCLLITGSAMAGQQKDLIKYNTLYESGHFKEAAEFEKKLVGDNQDNPSKLLQSLLTASALRYDHQYESSTSLFDACENSIKAHDEKSGAADVTRDIGATLINDKAVAYRGTQYDGIMLNTFKALNFWQLGQTDLARVEFNRALDRQRRAVEKFAAEINKVKEEMDKEAKSKGQPDPVDNPEINTIIRKNYSALDEYAVYPNFVNPFTSYVAGLFFMANGDNAKAASLFKEAYGMSKNRTVFDDLKNTAGASARRRRSSNHVWLLLENGSGPVKEEFRVDLPLFLASKEIKYTGIALPRLTFRDDAYPHVTLRDGGVSLGQTTLVASMDKVVQTEFRKRYPIILRRAILSSTLKTGIQVQAQKKIGFFGGLVAGIIQEATTGADLRIWTALPKNFQVAKVSIPKSGVLSVSTPDGKEMKIPISANENSLVYVKLPSIGGEPYYDVISMNK